MFTRRAVRSSKQHHRPGRNEARPLRSRRLLVAVVGSVLTVAAAILSVANADGFDPMWEVPEDLAELREKLAKLSERRERLLDRREDLEGELAQVVERVEMARATRDQLTPAYEQATQDQRFATQLQLWAMSVERLDWELEKPLGDRKESFEGWYVDLPRAAQQHFARLHEFIESLDDEASQTKLGERILEFSQARQVHVERWEEMDARLQDLLRERSRLTNRLSGTILRLEQTSLDMRANIAAHLALHGPRCLQRVRITQGRPRLDVLEESESFGGRYPAVYDFEWEEVGESNNEVLAILSAIQEFDRRSEWVDQLYETRESAFELAADQLDALSLEYKEMIVVQAVTETSIELADKAYGIISSGFNPVTVGLELGDVSYEAYRYYMEDIKKYGLPELSDDFVAARRQAGESIFAMEEMYRQLSSVEPKRRLARAIVQGDWSAFRALHGPPTVMHLARAEAAFEDFAEGQWDKAPGRFKKKLLKQLISASIRRAGDTSDGAILGRAVDQLGIWGSFVHYWKHPQLRPWNVTGRNDAEQAIDIVKQLITGDPAEAVGAMRRNLMSSGFFLDAEGNRLQRFQDLHRSSVVRDIAQDFVKDAVKDVINETIAQKRYDVYFQAAEKQMMVFASRNELFAARVFREAHYDAIGELGEMLWETLKDRGNRRASREAEGLAGEFLQGRDWNKYAVWLEFDGPVANASIRVLGDEGASQQIWAERVSADSSGRTFVVDLGMEQFPWPEERRFLLPSWTARKDLKEFSFDLEVTIAGDAQQIVLFDGFPRTPVSIAVPAVEGPLAGLSPETLSNIEYINADGGRDTNHHIKVLWPLLWLVEEGGRAWARDDGIVRLKRSDTITAHYLWADSKSWPPLPEDDRSSERWLVLRRVELWEKLGRIRWADRLRSASEEGIVDVPAPGPKHAGREFSLSLVRGIPGEAGSSLRRTAGLVADARFRMLAGAPEPFTDDLTGAWMVRSRGKGREWEGWVSLVRNNEGELEFGRGWMESPDGILPMKGFGMQWDGATLEGNWTPYWTGRGDSRARVSLQLNDEREFVGTRSVPEEWLNDEGWEAGDQDSTRVELSERWVRPPISAEARTVVSEGDQWVVGTPTWDEIVRAWNTSAGMSGNFPHLYIEVRGANLPVASRRDLNPVFSDRAYKVDALTTPDAPVDRGDLWGEDDLLRINVTLHPGATPGKKTLYLAGNEIPLNVECEGF